MSETGKQAVKRFVQEVLGCTCPDEVFLSINVEKNPLDFAEISKGVLITIGDKLLVYLISTNDGELLASKLEQVFNRARETRDKVGFNRFRLVVSSSREQSTGDILIQKFESLENLDERLHLHVIEPEQLPDLGVR